MLHAIILLVVALLLISTALFFPIRKTLRELKCARAISALESELLAIQCRKCATYKDAPEYQTLLEQEIRIRLDIGRLNPSHQFLEPVPRLLSECANQRGFAEWARAEMRALDRETVRFET